MHDLSVLRDLLIIFGLGVLVVLAFHRLRLPPIVGFLFTGALAGPYGFRLIRNVSDVEGLAEIGVILLLFTIGIEFSIEQLKRIRRFLLLGGGAQVGLTLGATAAIAIALGQPWEVAVFLGMLVALSSTAIVLRLLSDRGEMDSPHGRSQLGILIFQDLVVVPMVVIIPLLGAGEGGPMAILMRLAVATLFVFGAILAARYAVPWLLHRVVRTRSREIFILTIILVCLSAALASALAGLSLALGAFIAGLIVSESEYSHEALGEILPLREVFNSLFFVSIGMLFDPRTLLGNPLLVLATLIGVVLLKATITGVVGYSLGQSARLATLTGLGLAQIGEFSFVLSTIGQQAGLLDVGLNQLFLAVAVGSMALTPGLHAVAPLLGSALDRLTPRRFVTSRGLPALRAGERAMPANDHVVIIGYGNNGRILARVLARANVPFEIVETNAEAVRSERRRGRRIVYGDATRREILEHAGISRARVVVVAISDMPATRRIVEGVRRLNPHVSVVARTRYLQETATLERLGADDVVTEEFETAIEVFTRVLRKYLVPDEAINRATTVIRQEGAQPSRGSSDMQPTDLRQFVRGIAVEPLVVGPGSSIAGQPLAATMVRERYGVTVVAIQRAAGDLVVSPSGDQALSAGDTVLLFGDHDSLIAVRAVFSG